MNTKVILGIVLVAIVVLSFVGFYFGVYNGMVVRKNQVDKAWADVESAYQRRLDTIPKFAEVAKFSTKFQLELQLKYAEAREGLRNAATSGDPNKLVQAGNNGFTALVIAVRQEAVPEAKVDQLTELNAEIENIERVINHERVAFNEAVRDYNNVIQQVPGNWFASGWGFFSKEPFSAEPGAEKSPKLNLS